MVGDAFKRLGRAFDRRHMDRDLIDITQQFAMLLRAGESLDNTLDVLSSIAGGAIRQVLEQLRQDLRQGVMLSDALARHALFSELYVSVIRIGESRGDLASAFERIAQHLERQRELVDKVQSALTYPLLLILFTGISMVVLIGYVLPQFQTMFDNVGATLPWFTTLLLHAGEWLQRYAWIIIILLVALTAIARWRLRDPEQRYRWHRTLLRLPLLSELLKRLNVARFSRSLAVVLDGGTPIVDALRLSQTSLPNHYLRRSLDEVIDTIKQGGRLADGLRTHAMFPLLATRMIQVGEQSGELAKSLDYVARVYDRQVDVSVRRLVSILEPALIVAIGVLITFVIYAIVSAIRTLNTLPL